ncbi:MAG: WD40 repeat domain-containing protein [Pseudonocardiaceae bacterium]
MLASEPGWRTLAPILPGADPVAALARELAATGRRIGVNWTVEHVHQQLDVRGLTALADELLVADPRGPQRRLLVVIDQFEELLTQAPPGQRTRLAKLLLPALTGPVQVVATLRPEFLNQLLTNVELADLPTHTYTLRPLHREALRLVIEGPARLAGLDVDEHLVARLVGDTRQADAALTVATAAAGRRDEQVITGLLRLVTVDEQGHPTRWRVNRADLPTPVVTELDAFVARRLVTTDTDNGTVVIGVAHEKFLSVWAPLAETIAKNVTALRARRAIEHAATEWQDGGRPPARLWGGGQLAAVVADTGARICADSTAPPRREGPTRWLPHRHRELVTDRVDLSQNAHDFLHTSIRHDRSRRRRTVTVLSVLLILALVGAGVAVIQRRDAQDRQRIATAHELVARADATRDTDPRTALQLGVAAHRIHADGTTYASLVNTLTVTRYAGALTGHREAVRSVTFSPNGEILAGSDDNAIILWNLANSAQPHRLGQPLTGHTKGVYSVAFSPDGKTLATGSYDGTAILWNLTDLNDLRNHATERACAIAGRGLDRDEWARYVPNLPYQDTCPA